MDSLSVRRTTKRSVTRYFLEDIEEASCPTLRPKPTIGPIKFHEWLGDSGGVLFSHRGGVLNPIVSIHSPDLKSSRPSSAKLHGTPPTFRSATSSVIGISANGLEDHKVWIEDINKFSGKFPIIADPDRKISYIYDMLNYQDATNQGICKGLAIRTVFVCIDPKKVPIRLYALVPGRIIRAIDAIQLGDKLRIATPVNWKQGEESHHSRQHQNEEAKTLHCLHPAPLPSHRTTG
ncbi:cysteine peroxiredoxin [Mycena olivaceomarginata]|nr:cysteine peroxiredoxin [Mycena olivaceomarginata]